MAFQVAEFPQFRAQTSPVNGMHFWQVTCLDGDTVSDWQPTGFVSQAQDVGVFSTDGVSYPGTGRCRVQVNEEPVVIGGRRYPAGQAWRFVKTNDAGSGGTFRVRVGTFPSITWGQFSDPISNMTNI